MRFLVLGAHRKAVLKSHRLVFITLNGFCVLDPVSNIEIGGRGKPDYGWRGTTERLAEVRGKYGKHRERYLKPLHVLLIVNL